MSGFYKVLNSNLTSRNGGTYQWVLGEWAPEIAGELVPCENGYHVCQENDLAEWLGPVICEAEIGRQVLRADGKTVARTARIVKVLDTWDCAEQVLPVFESQRPDDDRPRTAIEVARLFARGEATADELAAAGAVAEAARAAAEAARDAARAAAGAAAGAAAEAAWDAARAAAGDAAWAAAWAAWAAWDAAWAAWAAWYAAKAAARDAERRWQTERLMAYLRGEVD
jgi:hypothetical protein